MTQLWIAVTTTVVLMASGIGVSHAAPGEFDPKAQGERYEAFLKEWNSNVSAAQRGEPKGEPLPFPTDGILTAKARARKAQRVQVNRDKFLADVDKAPADLGAILWAVEYAFSLKFVECVPEACFVEIFTEYSEPGFWMSLVDSPTGPLLNGVVYYRKAPKSPTADPRFKVWLAALNANTDAK